jgi:hypothetical protein
MDHNKFATININFSKELSIFMNKREYTLVLPAKLGPSDYGGKWAAGSVLAHWLHLKKESLESSGFGG